MYFILFLSYYIFSIDSSDLTAALFLYCEVHRWMHACLLWNKGRNILKHQLKSQDVTAKVSGQKSFVTLTWMWKISTQPYSFVKSSYQLFNFLCKVATWHCFKLINFVKTQYIAPSKTPRILIYTYCTSLVSLLFSFFFLLLSSVN